MNNIVPAICGSVMCGQTYCGQLNQSSDPKANLTIFNKEGRNLSYADYGENPKVNLAKGRIVYESADLSIGGGNYQIAISHYYNSLQSEEWNYCGKGWKLNIGQRVKKLDSDTYAYFDAIGDAYTFVLFDSTNSRYYNSADAGQVLTVSSDGTICISDDVGKKMYFDAAGRLDRIVSELNSNIVKKIEYDTNGRISKIYDARLKVSSTIRSYITLSYDGNGMLQSIAAYDNNRVLVAKLLYEYENGDRLIRIKRVAYDSNGNQGQSKTVKEFSYDGDDRLVMSTDSENKTAFKVTYAGDKVSNIDYGVIGSSFVSKSNNTYTYYSSNVSNYETVIKNEDGVETAFFLDTRYKIVSQFERANGTINSSFNTLALENGKPLSVSNYISVASGSDKINSGATYRSSHFELELKRNFKLSYYDKNEDRYYECSFWLKHGLDVERLKVIFEYRLNTADYTKAKSGTVEVWIDGRATNAWQKVSAVFELGKDYDLYALDMCGIKLYIPGNSSALPEFSITNLSFMAAPQTTCSVRDGTRKIAVNDIGRLYFAADGEIYDIKNNKTDIETYLTENDIARTVINMNAHYVNIGTHSCYDIICNDGTKRLPRAFGFVAELYNSTSSVKLLNNSTPMVTETIMSDKKVKIEQYFKFENNKLTFHSYNRYRENGYGGETSDNDHTTESFVVYNYKGQKLSETDEYGLTTEYTYDVYGQLKKIQKKASDGTIGETQEVTYDSNNENISRLSSAYSSSDFKYLSPFALNNETIKNSFNGSNYVNTGIKTKLTFNDYKDKITEVDLYNGSSSVSKNKIEYENGKIKKVTDGVVTYGVNTDLVNDKVTYTRFSSEGELTVQTNEITKNGTSKIHKSTFNGHINDVISTQVDKYGRVTNIKEGTSNKAYYSYSKGTGSPAVKKLSSVSDIYEDKTTTYLFDSYNNVIGWKKGTNHLQVQQVTAGDTKYTFGGIEKYFVHINYDAEKVVAPRIVSTGVSRDPNADDDDDTKEIKQYRKKYEYDGLGRLVAKKVSDSSLSYSYGSSESYEYLKVGASNTDIVKKCSFAQSNTITSYTTDGMFSLTYSTAQNESYTYDSRGRLLSVTNSVSCNKINEGSMTTTSKTILQDSQTKSYTYDELDRLLTEKDNKFGNKTYTYTSNGKLNNVVVDGVTRKYSYNLSGQLVAYNGNTYAYDAMGNRSSKILNNQSDKYTYSYIRGNLLSSINNSINYYYNCDGVRFKKVIGGVTTEFYLDGNKILGEVRGGKKLIYFYDADGLCGVRYNEVNYVYVRNAFGDIVMIASGGKPVARYYYDAWGNCKVEQYNDSNDIGNINPFRWKGHYFDAESGLYYANGSYYDPEVGLHLDAMPISAAIENAFEAFGLDLNGLMCDNVLAYLPYVYSAFTTIELTADPGYDLNANKPWWELAWNAIKSWFVSVVQWYNGLSNNTKTIIGIAFFALACAITAVVTYLTGGGGTGIITALWDMTVKFAIGVVTAAAISGVIALCSGGDIAEAITSAAADAILIGGIIAFVSAGVNAVKTVVRSVRNAKLIGSSQTGAQPCQTTNQCFKEGTLVETEEGLKPIEDIEVGDKVLAYDEVTGEQAYKPVVRLFRNSTEEWQYVYIEGETNPIISTPGHKYYLPNNNKHREEERPLEHASYSDLSEKWVSACKLKKGDKVLLSDGKYGIVEKTVCVQLTAPETTYNLEIADFHTYFVSELGVLVHNANCGGDFKKYTPDEIAKRGDITVEQFHREVKPEILKIAPKELGKNPDILLNKHNVVGLQSRINKKSFNTGRLLFDFIKRK